MAGNSANPFFFIFNSTVSKNSELYTNAIELHSKNTAKHLIYLLNLKLHQVENEKIYRTSYN